MSDGTRRDKPAFEPPPWERQAFDELARKRAEEEERRRGAERADAEAAQRWAEQARAAAAAAREPEPVAAPGTPVPPEAGQPTGAAIGSPAPQGEGPSESAAAPQPDKPVLDERQVKAMLIELSVEEPDVRRSVEPISRWMAIVVGVIGLGMMGMSVYFTAQTVGKPIGVMGGLIVGVFGAFFIGIAFWMWVRATRGKGS